MLLCQNPLNSLFSWGPKILKAQPWLFSPILVIKKFKITVSNSKLFFGTNSDGIIASINMVNLNFTKRLSLNKIKLPLGKLYFDKMYLFYEQRLFYGEILN